MKNEPFKLLKTWIFNIICQKNHKLSLFGIIFNI